MPSRAALLYLVRRRKPYGRLYKRRGIKMALMRKRRNPIVKQVMKAITKTEETKYVANVYSDSTTVQSQPYFAPINLGAVGNFLPALPAITQGPGDYQRIGNKIMPVSVATSLQVSFNPTDVSANEILCVVYYGTSKSGKSWVAGNPLNSARILETGDATEQVIFDGSKSTLQFPIDKKQVTMRKKVFKLAKTGGVQNSDAATGAPGAYSTNNGPVEKSLLLKFRKPKQLNYAKGTDLWPTNYAPIYAVSFCHVDGSALTHNDETLIQVQARNHMYFKDA